MSAGQQAVQSAHSLAQFAASYPDIFREWQQKHKNLIVLATPDEDALRGLFFDAAVLSKVECSAFREPDLNNELTAVALAPCEQTYKLTSSLPLALREKKPAMVAA